MRHPKLMEWDRSLKEMFDEIDDILEDKYGGEYPLHPNRPGRGRTGNKEMDGLFNIGADFSPGYGSSLGRGYIVTVHMSTLDHIPADARILIETEVESLVREKLPAAFPGRQLKLERDGSLLKITGNMSLGSVIQE